jgi:hypothetical protein
MQSKLSALERAFQLARSGQVASVAEIRTALRDEGYELRQLYGRTLLKQLRDLIASAAKR